MFLKLNQSQSTKKKILLGGFLQKPKTLFCRGKIKIVFKLKFQICIFEFVLYCKRKPHANFHKKILIFKALEFLKMKTLTHLRWRTPGTPKLWIWTSKILPDLWLLDLFCPIQKISTLHPNVHVTKRESYQGWVTFISLVAFYHSWEFAHQFSELIALFSKKWVNERFAKKERFTHLLIFGEWHELFAHIVHFWWATWAICAQRSLKKREWANRSFLK